jgi:hypothetical protein
VREEWESSIVTIKETKSVCVIGEKERKHVRIYVCLFVHCMCVCVSVCVCVCVCVCEREMGGGGRETSNKKKIERGERWLLEPKINCFVRLLFYQHYAKINYCTCLSCWNPAQLKLQRQFTISVQPIAFATLLLQYLYIFLTDSSSSKDKVLHICPILFEKKLHVNNDSKFIQYYNEVNRTTVILMVITWIEVLEPAKSYIFEIKNLSQFSTMYVAVGFKMNSSKEANQRKNHFW